VFPVPNKLISHHCPVCGVVFPARRTARFCSRSCARTRPAEERFWKRVNKDGECWEWTAAKSRDGYGNFCLKKPKTMLAHRVSYLWAYGELPANREVCHTCDNPSCVNPNHLFLATHLENMRDCVNKGRMNRISRKGENNAYNKYSTDTILRIRELAGTMTLKAIAATVGVSQSLVWQVVNRHAWKHLP